MFGNHFKKHKRRRGAFQEKHHSEASDGHAAPVPRSNKRKSQGQAHVVVSGSRRPSNCYHESKTSTDSGTSTLEDQSNKRPRMQQRSQNPRRARRGPPSEEALELSSRLKQLSREKKWNEALHIYGDTTNDKIRDIHHACIMVDMAARCGKIAEGERIVKELEDAKKPISVELKTALLKGYGHCGDMAKAEALFHGMCSPEVSKAKQPNVRTLNTFLRGCLWSAAVVGDDGESIAGGVVSAERAWNAYKNLKTGCEDTMFDVSSYEYFVTLLCQALRTNDARVRIQEMKLAFGVPEKTSGSSASEDQSLMESLAVMYLALGRAHAIVSEAKASAEACKSSIAFATASRNAVLSGSSFRRKRGRKESTGEDDRRSQSNVIYRKHRLSEIETEARTILDICGKCVYDSGLAIRELTRRLNTRLAYVSGGGTSPNAESDDQSTSNNRASSSIMQKRLMTSLFYSFGLSVMATKLSIQATNDHPVPLKKKECNKLLGAVGLQGGILDTDDKLNLHRMFTAGLGATKAGRNSKKKTKRIEVELGAGFGEWIVRKALDDPKTDFLAVELRADRVAQIFARSAILSYSTSIDNLCVVGGDSGRILSRFIPAGSIDTIYVNHPEPPTQTFGTDTAILRSIMNGGDEPAHMLHSTVLIAAVASLKGSAESRLIIVTDNKWYAWLICVTLDKVKKMNPGTLKDVDLSEADKTYTRIYIPELNTTSSIFEGNPNQTIGYPSSTKSEGNSYFDRLWRAGAGTHAENTARFVIVQRVV